MDFNHACINLNNLNLSYAMSRVQIYKTFKNTSGVIVPLIKLLKGVQTGHWGEQVSNYRKTRDSALKEKLPCFTVGGVFHPRKLIENLNEQSGVLELDVDDFEGSFEELLEISKKVIGDSLYSIFKSCGGSGYCVLVKIKPFEDYDQFKAIYNSAYQEMLPYLQSKSKFDWLPNLNRLRFVSYDPEVFINENAVDYVSEVPIQEVEVTSKGVTDTFRLVGSLTDEEKFAQVVGHYIEAVGDFGSGTKTRHDWVLGLARYCCRANISDSWLLGHILSNYQNSSRPEVWSTEVKRCVRDSYRTYATERGTYEPVKKFSYDDIKQVSTSEGAREQLLLLIADKINYKDYLASNKKSTTFVEKEISFYNILRTYL